MFIEDDRTYERNSSGLAAYSIAIRLRVLVEVLRTDPATMATLWESSLRTASPRAQSNSGLTTRKRYTLGSAIFQPANRCLQGNGVLRL
jgi:hypothetical protein